MTVQPFTLPQIAAYPSANHIVAYPVRRYGMRNVASYHHKAAKVRDKDYLHRGFNRRKNKEESTSFRKAMIPPPCYMQKLFNGKERKLKNKEKSLRALLHLAPEGPLRELFYRIYPYFGVFFKSSIWKTDVYKFQALLSTVIKKGLDLNEINDGRYTLLQTACVLKGREKFVSALLDFGANPNATLYDENDRPLLLAAYHGNSGALGFLVDHNSTDLAVSDEKAETALHKAAKMEMFGMNGTDYEKCIVILTKSIKKVDEEKPKEKRLDVNAMDAEGNTALHYAAFNLQIPGRNVEGIVRALVRAGSYFGIRNKMGELAISRIPKPAIKDIMTGCIGTKGKPYDKDYKLTFDYKNIVPPSNLSTGYKEKMGDGVCCNASIKETELLSYFCTSKEHQILLKHPIITSFLYLKWHCIRWIFYGYLSLYVTLALFLTPYIYVTYWKDSEEAVSEKMEWKDYFFIFSSILLMVLAFLEICLRVISPMNYVTKLENFLVLVTIVLTKVMLFAKLEHHVKQHLAFFSILLLWIVLFLLVGKHPRLSTCIRMFKTLFVTFIFIIAGFLLFLVAFEKSFVIFLNKWKPANEDLKQELEEGEENSLLSDLGISLIKTVLMLTGQLDLKDVPLNTFRSTSHLIVVLLIFLVTPVLFNRLLEYSAGDIKAVRDKSELIRYMLQVALISQVESIMLGRPLERISNLVSTINNRYLNHSNASGNPDINRNGLGQRSKFIFTFHQNRIFSGLKIVAVSVKDGKIQCSPVEEAYNYKYSMDRKVIQGARSIIANQSWRNKWKRM